ncbi:hypothetical protein GCM10010415_30550 [Streptomyces atrovirens]
MDLLAALVPTLRQTLDRAVAKAFVILDGTLLPIDRIAAALPGAMRDIKAARTHGIIDALAEVGLVRYGDEGYQGADGTVRVPSVASTATSPSAGRPSSHLTSHGPEIGKGSWSRACCECGQVTAPESPVR